jgi:hypothetical protein
MVYDTARQRVVLFGGQDGSSSYADTWVWNGNDWAQQSPATSPLPRWNHAMAYDADRQRVVLFGGRDRVAYADTWEWDGNDWRQRVATRNPIAQSDYAMAYDGAHQRMLLFGPGAPPYPWIGGDTWLYGPLTPATTQVIGSGCAGSNGPPLSSSNEPYLGNPAFRLQLLAARAASPVLFLLATAPADLDLGGGCRLYVQGSVVPFAAVSNAVGFADGPALSIPNDIALRGAVAHAQAVVADPNGPVAGFAFSDGRKLVIGD